MKNLKANDIINLELSYVDSTGATITNNGTGVIHSNSLIDPTNPKHQIRLTINFPELNISNATFRIQPQYGNIFITGDQLLDSNSQLVTSINISNTELPTIAYKYIDNSFIDDTIARVNQIPTTTGELTNDSGFITNAALTGYATETWVEQKGYLTSVAWGDITDKPTLATVATSGSYNDLIDKPTIPTTTGELTNNSGFITSEALTGYATTSDVSTAISSQTK